VNRRSKPGRPLLAFGLLTLACGPGRVAGSSDDVVGETGDDDRNGDGDGDPGDGDGDGDGDGESGDGDGDGESGDGDGDGESGDGDGDGEPPLPDLGPEDFCVFADPFLEAAVAEELDLEGGPVPKVLAETITNLSALPQVGSQPSSLVGIECLVNLVRLRLPAGTIDELTPLAELSSLASLSLRHNQIAQLQPLASLGDLQALDLWGNPIPDGALVDIAGLPLSTLDVSHSAITSLEDILLFEDLLMLGINGLPIADLSPLYGSGILGLMASETDISELSTLHSWGPLGCLSIKATSIVDLSPLLDVAWIDGESVCGTCPSLGVDAENLDDYSNDVVIPALCEMGINVNGCLFCPQ
jgi:hypothetical protein